MNPQKVRDPPSPWSMWCFFRVLKQNSKGVLGSKLWIWVLGGWGICLKVTLQTRATKNFRSCRWGPNGEFSVRRLGSEDPHWHERKLCLVLFPSHIWCQPYQCQWQQTHLHDWNICHGQEKHEPDSGYINRYQIWSELIQAIVSIILFLSFIPLNND